VVAEDVSLSLTGPGEASSLRSLDILRTLCSFAARAAIRTGSGVEGLHHGQASPDTSIRIIRERFPSRYANTMLGTTRNPRAFKVVEEFTAPFDPTHLVLVRGPTRLHAERPLLRREPGGAVVTGWVG